MLKMRNRAVLCFVFCLTIFWCVAQSQTYLDSEIDDSFLDSGELEKDYLFRAENARAEDDKNDDDKNEPDPTTDEIEPEPTTDKIEPEPKSTSEVPEPADKCTNQEIIDSCTGKNQECKNNKGTDECGVCKDGYKDRNEDVPEGEKDCTMIEECDEDSGKKKICDADGKNQMCQKLKDKDICVCKYDFEKEAGEDDSLICTAKQCPSEKVTECTGKPNQICQISKTTGVPECACKIDHENKGTEGVLDCQAKQCPSEKVTECTGNPNQECQISKTTGNPECACKKGYEDKGTAGLLECKKIHACKADQNPCPTETTECVEKGDDFYCRCRPGYVLENEEIEKNKVACQKETACNKRKDVCPETTICVVKENDYYCDCLPGHELKENVTKENNKEACISPCEADPCKNGGKCTVNDKKPEKYECTCAPFYTGVKCETNKCTPAMCKNKGKCNKDNNGCDCPFSHDGITCEKIKWCEKNICQEKEKPDTVECKYDTAKQVGYCKCKKGNFFDYVDKKCKNISACLNGCKTDKEICNIETGECECIPGYKPDDKKECKKIVLCKEKPCDDISESVCSETNGMVKCSCNATHYYANNECKDAACFLKKFRKNCKEDCPDGLERKDGDCKVKEGKCSKNCGDYGWCYKEGEDEKCACNDVAEFNENEKKCVLKEKVCPNGIKLKSDKLACDCKGKFKQSTNGVTCDRIVCAEKEAQDDCNKLNAVCRDEWHNENGFQCVCRPGYVLDDVTGICLDQCSTFENKRLCSHNSTKCFLDEDGKAKCRNPPGSSNKENSTFLIQNVPVKSAKYLLGIGSKLDIVSLASDIIKAMKHTFQNLEFVHLYTYRLQTDTVMCTVWLQFLMASQWDYQRLQMQTLSLTPPDTSVLPPNLILKKSLLGQVKEEEVKLCSGLKDDPFCGGAKCDDKKCACPDGYRVVDSSIQKIGNSYIFRCEDINECAEGIHTCSSTSTECENTDGNFYCRCLSRYKLKEKVEEKKNKDACIGLCDEPNPCKNGAECKIHEKKAVVNCKCKAGFSGAFCEDNDLNFAGQSKKTVVVGAVLGTILGVLVILIILFILRQKKKNAYSEDFTPCPQRPDNAEMMERRPVKGVTNRAYQ